MTQPEYEPTDQTPETQLAETTPTPPRQDDQRQAIHHEVKTKKTAAKAIAVAMTFVILSVLVYLVVSIMGIAPTIPLPVSR